MSGSDVTWVDGVLAESLPLPDRGLDFGDGLFETVLLVHGQALYFDLHLRRLERGLQVLGFPNCTPLVRSQVLSILDSRSFIKMAAMRVTITRGAGPRGYAPPNVTVPRIIITCTDLADDQYRHMACPARTSLASIRWGSQPALAGLKHLNRLEQVMAAAEKAKTGVDEVVMSGQDGSIISVSCGNIFLYAHGGLITPDLSECGVHGTRRELILESLAPALGLSCSVSRVSEAQLKEADEVFYCNALVGVRPIAQYASETWQTHGVCEALHELCWERVK